MRSGSCVHLGPPTRAAARTDRPRILPLDAAEIVFEADDVVLTEVAAVLHLDEREQIRADVLDLVRYTFRHVDRFARSDLDALPVERQRARAPEDEPVLGAPRVPLVAEPLARR